MAAGDMTNKNEYTFDTLNVVMADVEGPASYAAGGFAPAVAKFGLTTVERVVVDPIQSSALLAYFGLFDYATNKIKFYETGTVVDLPLVEVDDATNLAAIPIKITAYGKK